MRRVAIIVGALILLLGVYSCSRKHTVETRIPPLPPVPPPSPSVQAVKAKPPYAEKAVPGKVTLAYERKAPLPVTSATVPPPSPVAAETGTATEASTEASLETPSPRAKTTRVQSSQAPAVDDFKLDASTIYWTRTLHMRPKQPQVVIVRIARGVNGNPLAGLDHPELFTSHGIQTSRFATVDLFPVQMENDPVVSIKPLGQFAGQRTLAPDVPTDWMWNVTPLKAGTIELRLVVSTMVRDGDATRPQERFTDSEQITIQSSPLPDVDLNGASQSLLKAIFDGVVSNMTLLIGALLTALFAAFHKKIFAWLHLSTASTEPPTGKS